MIPLLPSTEVTQFAHQKTDYAWWQRTPRFEFHHAGVLWGIVETMVQIGGHFILIQDDRPRLRFFENTWVLESSDPPPIPQTIQRVLDEQKRKFLVVDHTPTSIKYVQPDSIGPSEIMIGKQIMMGSADRYYIHRAAWHDLTVDVRSYTPDGRWISERAEYMEKSRLYNED